MIQTVIIDPEFQRLLPDLDASTLADLEADIVANGIREPLVVWAEQSILLDGHNRYAIATRNDVPFNVERRSFTDRKAAADWIDRNQSMRRNLTPDQMTLIRGRRYNRNKLPVGNSEIRQTHQKGGIESVGTSTRLAAEHGVHRNTIERDGKFASAVEKLTAIDPTLEKRVVSGHGPTRKVIAAAAAAETPEEAAEILTAEKPLPKRPPVGTLKEQNGYRVTSLRAAPLRAEAATTSIETALECLADIDPATLAPFAERLSTARTALTKLVRSIA